MSWGYLEVASCPPWQNQRLNLYSISSKRTELTLDEGVHRFDSFKIDDSRLGEVSDLAPGGRLLLGEHLPRMVLGVGRVEIEEGLGPYSGKKQGEKRKQHRRR